MLVRALASSALEGTERVVRGVLDALRAGGSAAAGGALTRLEASEDRVPAVLSPAATLLTCRETVRARWDQFTGSEANCPRHGWVEIVGVEFDGDVIDEHGRPVAWSMMVLECGATLHPVQAG